MMRFIFFMVLLVTFSTQYQVPQPHFQVYKPKGFSVSLPSDDDSIDGFAFYGKINPELEDGKSEDFKSKITKPRHGKWILQNRNITLKEGDALYYILKVYKEGKEYILKDVFIFEGTSDYILRSDHHVKRRQIDDSEEVLCESEALIDVQGSFSHDHQSHDHHYFDDHPHGLDQEHGFNHHGPPHQHNHGHAHGHNHGHHKHSHGPPHGHNHGPPFAHAHDPDYELDHDNNFGHNHNHDYSFEHEHSKGFSLNNEKESFEHNKDNFANNFGHNQHDEYQNFPDHNHDHEHFLPEHDFYPPHHDDHELHFHNPNPIEQHISLLDLMESLIPQQPLQPQNPCEPQESFQPQKPFESQQPVSPTISNFPTDSSQKPFEPNNGQQNPIINMQFITTKAPTATPVVATSEELEIEQNVKEDVEVITSKPISSTTSTYDIDVRFKEEK